MSADQVDDLDADEQLDRERCDQRAARIRSAAGEPARLGHWPGRDDLSSSTDALRAALARLGRSKRDDDRARGAALVVEVLEALDRAAAAAGARPRSTPDAQAAALRARLE